MGGPASRVAENHNLSFLYFKQKGGWTSIWKDCAKTKKTEKTGKEKKRLAGPDAKKKKR